ncbi:hypothetical protein L7F22_004612 [Adiantum nelumboides]|nr:hypothetical protein [Adiantum nelumboides]
MPSKPEELHSHHLLFDKVLCNLPAATLGVARCVCKEWRKTLPHPESAIAAALKLSGAEACRRSPHLVVQTDDNTIQALDPIINEWNKISIKRSIGILCGVSQGLFCFRARPGFKDRCEKSDELVVGNPITDEWRELPPFPTGSRSLLYTKHWTSRVYLEADASRAWYKVWVLAERGQGSRPGTPEFLCFEYDSNGREWETYTQSAGREVSLMSQMVRCVHCEQFSAVVKHGGRLHYVFKSTSRTNAEEIGISYDVQEHVWRSEFGRTQTLSTEEGAPSVVAVNGGSRPRVVLMERCVGFLQRRLAEPQDAVPAALWEIDPHRRLWEIDPDRRALQDPATAALWEITPGRRTPTGDLYYRLITPEVMDQVVGPAGRVSAEASVFLLGADPNGDTLWMVLVGDLDNGRKTLAFNHQNNSFTFYTGCPAPFKARFFSCLTAALYFQPLLWLAPL